MAGSGRKKERERGMEEREKGKNEAKEREVLQGIGIVTDGLGKGPGGR